MNAARKKIWGWYFFDWASQPYNTLLVTFIFGPYIVSIMGSGSEAQTVWGYGIGVAGLFTALLSPLLGAVADKSSRRMGFMKAFSALYVVGSALLWFSAPDDFNIYFVMAAFSIGLIGMEFASTFSNAMLPDISTPKDMGRVSGSGWAFGYVGGIISLIVVLTLFVDSGNGKTLIGISPILGLDPETREGTRAVGPLTAVWYIIFIIPFFLWVHETPRPNTLPVRQAMRRAWPELRITLSEFPKRRSFFTYLISSMFSRDGLNGLYAFGGIYAAGVLNWSITQIGIFGILAALSGALFSWLGGKADSRFGPKPVIICALIILTLVATSLAFVNRTSVFMIPLAPGSSAPDIIFYILGSLIGGAGGVMQSAGRTMVIHQCDPEKVTQAFGLYALAGKTTSFIAPLSVAVVTEMSGSQQIGILPVVFLFIIGLVMMFWVKPSGDTLHI